MADVRTELGTANHAALIQRAKLLSWLTLAWLAVDGAIGLTAGIAANSVALIGWGIDCAIEAAASLVIIWRFTGTRVQSDAAERVAERVAQRVVAVSFLLLAPYIVVEAIDHLITGNAARASWIGIALAVADVILMPLFGRAKTTVGKLLRSGATMGAGRQNTLCAYLSLAVLIGLAANALFGLWWADPLVALAVAVICVQTGLQTWRGQSCDPLSCP
jgi:divalent metal cation (Fe/Co/Zn/Cd) transporter